MSANFPWEFFLSPEIRLQSPCKSPFSGNNKHTGNFSAFTQHKFVSPFCEADNLGLLPSNDSEIQASSMSHQHQHSHGFQSHLGRGRKDQRWHSSSSLPLLRSDNPLARMSHMGVSQLQDRLGNVEHMGEHWTLLLLFIREKRQLFLDITRIIKAVRTLSPFEKQTFRHAFNT